MPGLSHGPPPKRRSSSWMVKRIVRVVGANISAQVRTQFADIGHGVGATRQDGVLHPADQAGSAGLGGLEEHFDHRQL